MLHERLFLAETVHAEACGAERLLYAPDFPGLPVLISPEADELLQSFRGGAEVASVLRASPHPDTDARAIEGLAARGFLRPEPAVRPYKVTPRRSAPRDLVVWLHITNACNLSCSYCFVGEKTKSLMRPGTMEEVARQLLSTAQLHHIRVVYIKFAGGEPSTNLPGMRGFHEILEGVLDGTGVKACYEMLCNGTVMNEPLIAFLKEADVSVSVSLDGFGEAHDIHRVFKSGKGSWDLITGNIDTLRAQGVPVDILATISQESCHSLPQLVQWVTDRALPVRLQVVRNAGSSWCGGDRAEEYAGMNAEMADAFDATFTMLEEPEVSLDLRMALAICELQFDFPSEGVTCGIGSNMIVFRPDGQLASCPMTVSEKGKPAGADLVKAAATTFPHSPHQRANEDAKSDCLSCRWFRVCGGGCPVANERINGHPFSRSPLCSFYKAVIPRFVRFFGVKLSQARVRPEAGGPEELVPGMIWGYRQPFFEQDRAQAA